MPDARSRLGEDSTKILELYVLLKDGLAISETNFQAIRKRRACRPSLRSYSRSARADALSYLSFWQITQTELSPAFHAPGGEARFLS